MDKPVSRLAITPGDPAGIGPDLLLQLASRPHDFQLIAIASKDMLEQRAQQLGLTVSFTDYNPAEPAVAHNNALLPVLDTALASEAVAGQLIKDNARYVLQTIERATRGCLSGEFDALVTGPVHKGIINDAGIPFTGHTEYLSELCDNAMPVMMLATDEMRVALVTTHLPLKAVSDAITRERLSEIISILNHDLKQRFGLKQPEILVLGLNPHAGENGHLGDEEITTIQPVIDQFNRQGMRLTGALPADTAFTHRYLDKADAILAMYHDQGLPVLKHSGFGKAVNITLGLPIIRTSVDHGTALELAGTGKADAGSFIYACQVADNMVQQQLQQLKGCA